MRAWGIVPRAWEATHTKPGLLESRIRPWGALASRPAAPRLGQALAIIAPCAPVSLYRQNGDNNCVPLPLPSSAPGARVCLHVRSVRSQLPGLPASAPCVHLRRQGPHGGGAEQGRGQQVRACTCIDACFPPSPHHRASEILHPVTKKCDAHASCPSASHPGITQQLVASSSVV